MSADKPKKLRYSRAREQIYEYIFSVKTHPTAEEVYLRLKKSIPEISLGTVYRNLKQLEQEGRIVRVASVNEKERYDALCHSHLHFVCDKCGSVSDINGIDPNSLNVPEVLDGRYNVQRISVILGGLCINCNKEKENEQQY